MSKGPKVACGDALDRVAPVLTLLGGPKVAMVAGSLRRGKEYVHDADVVVNGPLPDQAAVEAAGFKWLQGGDRSIRLRAKGLQVDVHRAVEGGFGACLLYLTGPHEFNLKTRAHAADLGLLLNEKGVFEPCDESDVDKRRVGTDFVHVKRKGETEKRWYRRIAGETEREVLEAIGLDYCSPAGRERLKPFQRKVVWSMTVRSSRKGVKPYEVTLTDDGVWHCQCKGFTFCKAKPKTCRHIEKTAKPAYEREKAAA